MGVGISFRQEVQVGGHGTLLNKFLIGLGIVGAVAGMAVYANEGPVGLLIIVPSLIVFLVASVIGLMRRKRRAWLTDTGQGFEYRNRATTASVSDDEVVGMNFVNKPNYSQGELKSYTRKMQLKATSCPIVDIVHTAKITENDPLGSFLDRTITNYQTRAEEALESGARLSGNDWSMSRDEIEIQGKESRRISISNLAAINLIDDEYHIWDHDHEKPILRVPHESDNAFLLGLMLSPKVAEQNKDRKSDISEPGLGRQIFERSTGRLGRAFAILCFVFAALSFLCGIAVAAFGGADVIIGAIVALATGGVLALIGLGLRRSEFRCHERGVFKKGLFGSKELRFENVDTFSYSATRQYYNGAYTGTIMVLNFVPKPGTDSKHFSYTRNVQNADDALDGLRDHISQVLAVRMANELQETGQTQWMPHVRITNEGLAFRPQGFVKRKDEQMLEFANLAGIDIQQGNFYAWRNGDDKPCISEAVGQPNFFPGYYVLVTLFSGEGDESEDMPLDEGKAESH